MAMHSTQLSASMQHPTAGRPCHPCQPSAVGVLQQWRMGCSTLLEGIVAVDSSTRPSTSAQPPTPGHHTHPCQPSGAMVVRWCYEWRYGAPSNDRSRFWAPCTAEPRSRPLNLGEWEPLVSDRQSFIWPRWGITLSRTNMSLGETEVLVCPDTVYWRNVEEPVFGVRGLCGIV